MITADDGSVAPISSQTLAEATAQREVRARLILSLEREYPARALNYPDDIYDVDVWTDDEIVDFFDSGTVTCSAFTRAVRSIRPVH
jgi:hypothetical protein